MHIVIDIPNWLYNAIMEHREPVYSQSLGDAVRDGTPLPDGAEILTKEAYSDLCTRAADVPNFESEKYIEERLNNYNKLLKSGVLDCVTEKSQESEDKA